MHAATLLGAKLFKLPTVDFETTSFQESTLFGSLSSEAVERAGGDFTVSEDVHNMLDVDAGLLPPDDKAPAEDDDDLIDVDEDADGVWESPKPQRRGAVDVEDLAGSPFQLDDELQTMRERQDNRSGPSVEVRTPSKHRRKAPKRKRQAADATNALTDDNQAVAGCQQLPGLASGEPATVPASVAAPQCAAQQSIQIQQQAYAIHALQQYALQQQQAQQMLAAVAAQQGHVNPHASTDNLASTRVAPSCPSDAPRDG